MAGGKDVLVVEVLAVLEEVVLVDGEVDGTLDVEVELGALLVLGVELAEDELVALDVLEIAGDELNAPASVVLVVDGVLVDAPVELLEEELDDTASVELVLEGGVLDELDDAEVEADVPDVVETVV
jgi:hypothetical protein